MSAFRLAILLLLCSFRFTFNTHATDILDQWHQWRGPLATGEAPRADPPVRWNSTENVQWRIELPGAGSATPIVWDDHVFLATAVEQERLASKETVAELAELNRGQRTSPPTRFYRFVLLDIDRKTGRIRWQRTAIETVPHEGRHETNTYASASPVTDGQRVYVSFGSRGVYCYDLAGQMLWQRQFGQMRTRRGWGEGASPALLPSDNTLFVNWDQELDSFLVALDANTGETKWRVRRDEPTSWSTPLITKSHGQVQVVTSATNRIRSYDAQNGRLRWECGGLTTNVIACPVKSEDAVICMSWYGKSAVLAVPLNSKGDLTDSDRLLWTYDDMAPYCPSPLLYRNRIFFFRGNTTLLTGLDAKTGAVRFGPLRLPEVGRNVYASPVAAADRLYFVDREGKTLVLQHGDELKQLSVNDIGEPVDASPAIVGKQLFLRGADHLYCIAED